MTGEDKPNPYCSLCDGEGETYHYLVNHSRKLVYFDWQYCTVCFPHSDGVFPDNYDEIEVEEFCELLKQGYVEKD